MRAIEKMGVGLASITGFGTGEVMTHLFSQNTLLGIGIGLTCALIAGFGTERAIQKFSTNRQYIIPDLPKDIEEKTWKTAIEQGLHFGNALPLTLNDFNEPK